ncbi:efflux transporter, outer membrane factor (OMF) lipoprotein, NodT family [Paraburkholderia caballeronis]|uniref:Efflux transporter, outer membrane factor (OMF) lipoprotein, NodT family n=1 Tax=Paraburkholderia caballeronis TaxID=416943 RepID=A0A1H7HG03_9BURK|nr:NodT family efflux transporter outer membrane factor (OMF) lipoprotein [Paraburkholderia caballeronis]PXX04779.1 NodT family efflux transporter outer membrane factor (OMF) lipoprotein [Paraburkholderia caballeronis]RAK05840.1 NodT family efflux transporter outer membrane factor (OMF) lipoprotein [Paraburkholderia caballeronis]TDV37251.1 NodT family efflux transporter outer membrane factor (OMF) lipoprotein [Paraburkholderia caballeronis]SEB41828.1 efflux transporter, outer membrane factor (O
MKRASPGSPRAATVSAALAAWVGRALRPKRRAAKTFAPASRAKPSACGTRSARVARPARALPTAAVIVAAALAGCTVGPDYVRPTATVAATYKELEGTGWTTAKPADTAPRGAWWQIYDDAQLDGLEQQVEHANQNVQAAQARFRAARANVAQQRSAFFPLVTANGGFSRARTSANIEHRSTAGIALNDYIAGVDASWEPDLWGRVSRSVEGAKAGAQANAADAAAMLLSMQAELATDYFELRGIDRERQLLDDTIAAYRESVQLTQHRYDGGIATDADVGQAQTQLQTTEAQAIDLGVQRAQLEHAIAILIGQSPSTFSLPVEPLKATPVVSPTGLPSTLLERRPDIAAAERQVVAANAQIGVATAAFFPNLVLAVTGGLEATNYSQWLLAPARFWSLGPTLAGTLLDFGGREAVRNEARAQYDESVAQYRQTVLDAFGQVEDNLATLRVLEQEALAQDRAVAAAQRTLAIVNDRYRSGAITYLDVVVAQTTALSNERQAVAIARRRMAASVGLVKALGGGWQASDLPTDEQLVHPDRQAAPAAAATPATKPGEAATRG